MKALLVAHRQHFALLCRQPDQFFTFIYSPAHGLLDQYVQILPQCLSDELGVSAVRRGHDHRIHAPHVEELFRTSAQVRDIRLVKAFELRAIAVEYGHQVEVFASKSRRDVGDRGGDPRPYDPE